MPRNALTPPGVFEPDPTNPLAGSYTAADAADWHSQNVRDAWAAAKDPQTWQDAADQYRSGLLMGSVAPEMKGLGLDAAGMKVLRDMTPGFRAYHGSPHSFDQFSSDKIGTGEGAQAYGHGLYFADSEGVARSYRDTLGGVQYHVDGQPIPTSDGATRTVVDHMQQTGWTAQQALDNAQSRLADLQAKYNAGPKGFLGPMAQQIDYLKDKFIPTAASLVGKTVEARPAGHMYEVNVASDPAHFLDWDKPLSEQTPHVQQALAKLPIDATAGRPISYGEMKPHIAAMQGVLSGTPFGNIAERVLDPAAKGFDLDALRTYLGPEKAAAFDQARSAYAKTTELRGKEIHDLLADKYDDFSGNQPTAAERLQAAGIPGIRYLDGSSRAGGQGTSNHVIFDPETIKILRKYGIAGLMAGGGAAAASGQPQQ